MNKVKLTQEQVDAINYALDSCGDAESLIKMHSFMINKGHLWTGNFAALNTVKIYQLENVLRYDYKIIQNRPQKVKLPTEVARAVEVLCYEHRLDVKEVLDMHKEYPNGWVNDFKVLNDFDYQTLEQALEKGYVKGDSFIPTKQKEAPIEMETGDKTNLSHDDYMSMIDIALMTGDKVWFDELHKRMR